MSPVGVDEFVVLKCNCTKYRATESSGLVAVYTSMNSRP